MVENKHFTLENSKFFCLDQNFDNVTCCIPSFDFRAPSAQACIVSALSAVHTIQSQSARFYYDTLLKSVARVVFIISYGCYLNNVPQYPIHPFLLGFVALAFVPHTLLI